MTKEKINQIIADQMGIKIEEVLEDKRLEDLGADSLDRVELVMELEDVFEFAIQDEEADKLLTVRDFHAYIEGRL